MAGVPPAAVRQRKLNVESRKAGKELEMPGRFSFPEFLISIWFFRNCSASQGQIPKREMLLTAIDVQVARGA